MEYVKTPFLEFLTTQVPTRREISPKHRIRLDLSLLDGFVQSIVQLILTDKLSLEEELWLIDLVDGLKEEKETIEAKLAQETGEERDPLIGWYLHQRSQSGFELES